MSTYGKPILLMGSSTINGNNYTNFFQFAPDSGIGGIYFTDEGSGNWRIKFTKSGTLTVQKTKNLKIDLFLVGGGGGGGPCNIWSDGSGNYGHYNGGGGGGGGYTETYTNQDLSNTVYKITIGSGGAPGVSYDASGSTVTNHGSRGTIGGTGGVTAFKTNADLILYSANGGSGGSGSTGGDGGSGGGAGGIGWGCPNNSNIQSSESYKKYWYRSGNGGSNGDPGGKNGDPTKTMGANAGGDGTGNNTGFFGADADADGYGGGGGGGAGVSFHNNSSYTLNGPVNTDDFLLYGQGGTGGGGNGGKITSAPRQDRMAKVTANAATNGASYKGGGGGGGSYGVSAGYGGSGVLFIRNTRQEV